MVGVGDGVSVGGGVGVGVSVGVGDGVSIGVMVGVGVSVGVGDGVSVGGKGVGVGSSSTLIEVAFSTLWPSQVTTTLTL